MTLSIQIQLLALMTDLAHFTGRAINKNSGRFDNPCHNQVIEHSVYLATVTVKRARTEESQNQALLHRSMQGGKLKRTRRSH